MGLLALTIASCLLVLASGLLGVSAQQSQLSLPPLKPHPLPSTLVKWQDSQQVGDYLEQIEPSPLGYLIWSEFPVKIYLDRPENSDNPTASLRRFQQWVEGVREAIAEWKVYLPLEEVDQAKLADVVIERSLPPLNSQFNPETGQLEIPRARSAQTRYEFYLREGNSPVVSHRMTIQVSPALSPQSILAATRHELGHALGIWGHSLLETDALYFSQVRNPPSISARDINTLKKIYQQPTRLGWKVEKRESVGN